MVGKVGNQCFLGGGVLHMNGLEIFFFKSSLSSSLSHPTLKCFSLVVFIWYLANQGEKKFPMPEVCLVMI